MPHRESSQARSAGVGHVVSKMTVSPTPSTIRAPSLDLL